MQTNVAKDYVTTFDMLANIEGTINHLAVRLEELENKLFGTGLAECGKSEEYAVDADSFLRRINNGALNAETILTRITMRLGDRAEKQVGKAVSR